MRKLALPIEKLTKAENLVFQQILDWYVEDYKNNQELENRDEDRESGGSGEATPFFWNAVGYFKHELMELLRDFLIDRFNNNNGEPSEEEIFEYNGDSQYWADQQKSLKEYQDLLVNSSSDSEEKYYHDLSVSTKKKMKNIQEVSKTHYYDKKIGDNLDLLFDEGEALYLCYMTIGGEGVGIWDSEIWESVFDKNEIANLKGLLHKLDQQYQDLQENMEDIASESV